MRRVAALAGLVLLAACAGNAPEYVPPLPGEAVSQRDVTTAAAREDYTVSMSSAREGALVRVATPQPTISAIEAVARRQSGCRATAIENLYTVMGGDRDAVIPAAEIRRYGSSVPVILACR